MVIFGIALGQRSTVLPALMTAALVFIAFTKADLYGESIVLSGNCCVDDDACQNGLLIWPVCAFENRSLFFGLMLSWG